MRCIRLTTVLLLLLCRFWQIFFVIVILSFRIRSVIGKGSSIRPAYFPELLSEKYAHDYTWYVDTILNLIRLAGDYVSEEVWYRIVQVVINTQEVQGYAAKTCFEVRQEMVSKSVCVKRRGGG